jgi:hypothetical protein
METSLDELRRLAAHAQNRRTETGIPRVAMVQGAIPEHELAAVYDPMVNLILRGSKSMTIGDRTLHYDPATYFVMSIDLPAVGTIHPASSGEPYLAVSLTIDPQVVGAMLADAAPVTPVPRPEAFSVATVTPELLDAWVRMLWLIERPADIAMLAPAYEREILYRLLQARMLLISGGQSAAAVAFDVGYESASQFSREYTRFFGTPPARDGLMLRGAR